MNNPAARNRADPCHRPGGRAHWRGVRPPLAAGATHEPAGRQPVGRPGAIRQPRAGDGAALRRPGALCAPHRLRRHPVHLFGIRPGDRSGRRGRRRADLQAQRSDVRRGAGALPRGRHAGTRRHFRAFAGADGRRTDGQGAPGRVPCHLAHRVRARSHAGPGTGTRGAAPPEDRRGRARPARLRRRDAGAVFHGGSRARCAGRIGLSGRSAAPIAPCWRCESG